MRIRLLTITHKTPSWVLEGYQEYAKRLNASCSLELVEIPAEKRTNNSNIKRLIEREGEKILAKINREHYIVALDVKGKLWSTEDLANNLSDWSREGKHVDLLVGGPDGLSQACLQKAQTHWSLSPLTFPHFIIRILVAEQIYRAHSILQKHPYHR